jgi:hypothetical protein
MNQDERLNEIIHRVARHEKLTEIELPHELAEPSSFLKVLKARHYNWESDHFRKIFGMRFSVKIPPIQQLNCIFYPRYDYSMPIFIFFFMLTKRKVIAHLNVNCPFDDAAYKQRWVNPLTDMLSRFAPFECDDRYPEWMKKYRNESTIYGLFPLERLQDISDCCFAYLDYYLNQVKDEGPATDLDRLKQIGAFHNQWVEDIRTQDKAQGMIAKMIGARTARRIFYEVTT